MIIFELFISFLVGISFGSFMNVINYRVPLKMSLIKPASSCPSCNHKIKFYENVPVLGWLFLKGKCSSCKEPISKEYPLVELFFGLFSVFYFYMSNYEFSVQTVAGYFMFYFLFSLSIIDFKIKMVPISLLVFSFILGVVYTGEYFLSTITGFAILGFFYMFKLTYEHFRGIEVLGEGDLPILGLFGVLLGLSNILIYGILGACIIGTLLAIFIYIKKKELEIPFVPALVISLTVCHFYFLDTVKNYLSISF